MDDNKPESETPDLNQDVMQPGQEIKPGASSTSSASKTETTDQKSETTPTPLAISNSSPMKQPKSKKGVLTLVVIALLVLVTVGGGVFALLNKPSKNKSATNNEVVKKDIPNIRYVTGNKGWETFYPAIDTSSNYQESNIMLFEGLVRYENKTQIVPLLSTGWTNPDDLTWVFTLKKGVKFHSGREMTAEDVKLSFEAAKDTDTGELFASTIKSMEATEPYKITIKTDGPDPTLLNKLTNYWVFDTKSGKANDPVNGTGPFIVKPGTTPMPESLELIAYDEYHGGRINVRSFSFIGNEKDDSGQSYFDGKADLMSFTGDRPAPSTATTPYLQIDTDQLSVFMIALNHLRKDSPLQNLKVRQALLYAIDPVAVAKARNVEGLPASQLVPSAVPGFDSSVVRPARDVNKAKQLLKEAGYPNGVTLTLTYFAPSKVTAEEIAKELKEGGINIVLDPQTEVKNLAKKAQGGGTDSYFITVSTDILDASDILGQYADSPNYKNQAVIDLLDKSQKTLDSTKRLVFLKEASRKLAEDVVTVPVFTPKSTPIIYNPSYVIQRDIGNSNIGIYFWKVYAK